MKLIFRIMISWILTSFWEAVVRQQKNGMSTRTDIVLSDGEEFDVELDIGI